MDLFNRIKLKTPESVELEFILAGLGNRAYALLIDYLMLTVIGLVYQLTVIGVVIWLPEQVGGLFDSIDNLRLWLFALLGLGYYAIYTGYFVVVETLWQGQTVGKRWVRIRVIGDNGRPIRLGQATLRSLLRPFDDFLCLGVLLILFTRREKRLGDWIGGTVVIQEDRSTAVAIATSELAADLAEQLLEEGDISRLLPQDFAVICQYLQRKEVMLLQARRDLSLRLAERAKELIALEKVPPNVTPTLFLEAVYLSYQKYYGQNN
ncbi:MAG: RDD family protein [Chloroflexaceae bacterium]|nr:RDD family protein [Chloroflexaceae bacterium]